MFSKTDIEKYFIGEKQESFWFIVIGLCAVVLALAFFLIYKAAFYKGAAIPLIIVGLILGFAGYTVNRRSDSDRIKNVYAYDMDPSQLKNKEMPRMEKVMKNFIILRYIEVILFLIGLGVYVYFIRDFRNDFWRGFGLTLAIMALIALLGDYFAESRGKKYIKGLREFTTGKLS
jgi:hypothetical protein